MSAMRQRGGFWRIGAQTLILFGAGMPVMAATYSGGNGTSTAPYRLSTAADLATLAGTREDWGKWFVLTADVDMKSTPWGPTTTIGVKPLPFTGVFDGAGHSLKGLAIEDTAAGKTPLGFFGVLGSPALIERLRFTTPTVKSNGNASIGVLAGLTLSGAIVQQCSVESGSVATPVSDAAGSLIGDHGGTVRECYVSGAVTAFGLAGGLLGRNTGTVENCAASATVTALKSGTGTAAGGLSGASVSGTFNFCFANSPGLTGEKSGGLIGYDNLTSNYRNCVCNKVVPKAVNNWTADQRGQAWCETPENLKSAAFFTGLGWDLKKIWYMDAGGTLRLQWMNVGPVAVIKELPGTIHTDPATGFARVALDGSTSLDPGGSGLTYQWQCLAADGKATNISIPSLSTPSVDLPVGVYSIVLTVSNKLVESSPTSITITVVAGTVNHPPQAVIRGPNDVVQPDLGTGLALVALDGSGSSDPDGDQLRFNWKCLTADGAATNYQIASVGRPSVSLPVGVYRIELRVNDGTEDSAPAALPVTVAVIPPNTPPTAALKGPSGIVRPDPATGLARVALEGCGSSDPDQDQLTYHWRCLTAAGQAMDAAIDAVCNPVVNLPAGQYQIELTVNDGAVDSERQLVSVTVNTKPVAEAGPAQDVYLTGSESCQVKLDGSKSYDPEAGKGQTLTYTWTCATANPTSVSGPTPSLTLPAGVHTVTLTVSDGIEESQDSVQITVGRATAAAKVAASPSTVGRASTISDVVFYVLLPAGKTVSDVNTQAAITLDYNGTATPLTRDVSYSHKVATVVAYTSRQKVLDLMGTTNGSMPVKVYIPLKSGPAVEALVTLQITAGVGMDPAAVRADRAFYYLDSQTWK